MHSVVFESANGEVFSFDPKNNVVFSANLGEGLDVDLNLSQGFSQIGESLEGQSVGGKPINIKGVLIGNVQQLKDRLRRVCSPFSSGKLIFENGYYAKVFVKKTPSFSIAKDDGRFTMQFYAPFPAFFTGEKYVSIGDIVPKFSFPINYEMPHKFGERSRSRFQKISNDGDFAVPYKLELKCIGTSTNPVMTDLETFEFVKLNGQLQAGDTFRIYVENNVLVATLEREGAIMDALSWIDDKSTLFDIKRGNSLISVSDEEDGAGLVAGISFSPAVVSVYES